MVIRTSVRAAALAAALAPAVLLAAPQWRAEVAVAGYAGAAPLTNFPVLVRLSEAAIPGFRYADCAAGGADLAFEDAGGAALDREIESWDPDGESLVWVRLPLLTNGIAFAATWGDPATASQPPSQTDGSVWCPAGYAGVWHMAEASGTVADSAAHGLDASPTGADAANACVAVAGPVGNGRQCSTNATDLSYLSVPARPTLNVGASFAVSGWFDVSADQSGDARFFSRKASYKDENGWEIVWKPDNNGEISVRGASQQIITSARIGAGAWRHLCVVYVTNSVTVYVDGELKARRTYGAAPTDNGKPLAIGAYPMDHGAQLVGSVDECRLLRATPTADWVGAEHDAQSRTDFLSYGAARRISADFVLVEGAPSRYAAGGLPAYGREESPAAGVHAFSAPAFVELAPGTRAVCTGWSLYDVASGAETPVRTSATPNAGEDGLACRKRRIALDFRDGSVRKPSSDLHRLRCAVRAEQPQRLLAARRTRTLARAAWGWRMVAEGSGRYGEHAARLGDVYGDVGGHAGEKFS